MAQSSARPDRTTMQGMVWNANHVLDRALDPETNGIPKELFSKTIGIVLISVVEAGFIFTGNVGTGILLAKKHDGSWSKPSAIGLTGVGWGFVAGLSLKDVMVFILDRETLSALAGDAGIKFGGQGELTVGPFGRSADLSLALSNTGAGGTVSVSFSKGFFGGINIEGALIAPRSAVNETFYGISVTPMQILFDDHLVDFPDGNKTLMPEVYKKLDLLSKGEMMALSEEEKEKVAAMKKEADSAANEANRAEDVVYVNITEEAEKEASA